MCVYVCKRQLLNNVISEASASITFNYLSLWGAGGDGGKIPEGPRGPCKPQDLLCRTHLSPPPPWSPWAMHLLRAASFPRPRRAPHIKPTLISAEDPFVPSPGPQGHHFPQGHPLQSPCFPQGAGPELEASARTLGPKFPGVQKNPGVRSSTGTHAWGVSRASRSVWPGWGRGPPKHMLLTSPRQPLPSLGDRRSASCSPSMPATVPACLMPRCPGVPHPSFLRYSEGARTSLLAEVTPSLKPFGDRVTWLQEASAHKVPMAWGAPRGPWGLQH